MRPNLLPFCCGLIAAFLSPVAAAPGEWSGYVAGEVRAYARDGQFARQERAYPALALQPEYYVDWANGDQRLTFTGFLRLDPYDGERTHVDIRELYWEQSADTWEARAGLRKMFWGVTESQHLVDVLNQTDLVERPDGEEKLGQPMLELNLIRPWGIVDLYLLPFFRERTFPGLDGRLRPPLGIDTEAAVYESGADQFHLDLAARWSHTLGLVDVGIGHFYGTNRSPALTPGADTAAEPLLIPHYDLVHQTSLDLQATTETTLWKLEAIAHLGDFDDYVAITGGFEYSFWDLRQSGMDIGLLAEYLYDHRGKNGPNPFDSDLFAGSRLAVNDVQSSELLAGLLIDTNSGARLLTVEASRRLYANWRAELEIRAFTALKKSDPLYAFRKDHYAQLRLARYF